MVIRMFYDDHNPPNFHVEYQEFEAIVEIQSGIVTGTIPRRTLKLAYEWLDLHKEELLANWELMRRDEPTFKIEPLK